MDKIYIPERFKGRIGYHIFVDRFSRIEPWLEPIENRRIKNWDDFMPDWWPDSDGEYRNEYYYGGNLKGIIRELDYISELSVDLLYLSPISKTHTNHHYDVEDQMEIDPYIGSWEDFSTLTSEAHKRGILIAVDLVFNHMGAKSKFFQMALAGDENYRKWFEWDNSGNPIFWCGFKDMPQTNKLCAEFQKYAREVATKYVMCGADCIRLDLGELFPKEFMEKFSKRVKSINPEVLIVSEMWDFAFFKSNPQIYDGQVDSVMNYPLSDAIIRWERYGNHLHFNACMSNLSKYPKNVQDVLWNHLDTHDTPRLLNMLDGKGMLEDPYRGRVWDIEAPWRRNDGFDTYGFRKWESPNDFCLNEMAIKRLQNAVTIQFMMKGIPMIFYGTEVGLSGYKDPFNRKPYPWKNENQAIRQFYIELGKVRKENCDILADGDIYTQTNPSTMEIVRRSESGIIIAYINSTNEVQRINITYPNSKVIFSLHGSTDRTLQPYGATICRF